MRSGAGAAVALALTVLSAASSVTSSAQAEAVDGYLCQFLEADGPTACTITYEDDRITFSDGARAHTWAGQAGGDFWFGTLDGREAAAYALNRSHVKFSTKDRELVFEYWRPGSRAED